MTDTCRSRDMAAADRADAQHPSGPQDLPSHDARTLTRGGAQARITLEGQVYTLRITRAGKLILTK